MRRKAPNVPPPPVYPEGCDRMDLPVSKPSQLEQVVDEVMGNRLDEDAERLLSPEVRNMALGALLIAFDEHPVRVGIPEKDHPAYLQEIGDYVTELIRQTNLGEVA